MTLVHVPGAGAAGVVKDLSIPNLPPSAWTDAKNIRFLDGSAVCFLGQQPVYEGNPVHPMHVLPVTVAGVRSWIYAGAQKTYLITPGSPVVHTPLTRQVGGVDDDYSGAPNAWTSTVVGGVPVLNNGVDPPQQWLLDPGQRMTDLSAWPADTTCRVMRAFKNSLVALGVTKAGDDYPYMVKWSHPADPGTLPVTWDPSDATKDAGEFDLADGYDKIIDGLPLRGSFMIYKESSIWRMDYIGGVYVYSFNKVLGTSGALNRNCIVELDGQHLVLTASDVIVHDGQTSTSVLDRQARIRLFEEIDVQYIHQAFVFKNPFLKEVFICYPSVGSASPNRALVWNWRDRTVAFRDIPNIWHAAHGPMQPEMGIAWEDAAFPWADAATPWNIAQGWPDQERVIMAGQSQLMLLDSGNSFGGVKPPAYLERVGMDLGAADVIKTMKGVRLQVKGTPGETVMVQMGASSDQYAAPTWQPSVPHVIGSTVQCDGFVSGRYLAIRIASGTSSNWRLDGYAMDIVRKGRW